MNRRGFLRGVLSVVAASVAAKVAPKRPVAEPVMGVGRGSLLVMDNLGICNADAVLPEYVGGEAAGLFAHDPTRVVFHGDTVIEGDLEVNGTLTVRGTVTVHDSDAFFDQLVTGIERSGDMLQDHWHVCQALMADPDTIIRRQAAAWRGKGA